MVAASALADQGRYARSPRVPGRARRRERTSPSPTRCGCGTSGRRPGEGRAPDEAARGVPQDRPPRRVGVRRGRAAGSAVLSRARLRASAPRCASSGRALGVHRGSSRSRRSDRDRTGGRRPPRTPRRARSVRARSIIVRPRVGIGLERAPHGLGPRADTSPRRDRSPPSDRATGAEVRREQRRRAFARAHPVDARERSLDVGLGRRHAPADSNRPTAGTSRPPRP